MTKDKFNIFGRPRTSNTEEHLKLIKKILPYNRKVTFNGLFESIFTNVINMKRRSNLSRNG